MTTPFLSVERLSQRYPDGEGGQTTIFENASFGIERGEFVIILDTVFFGIKVIRGIIKRRITRRLAFSLISFIE